MHICFDRQVQKVASYPFCNTKQDITIIQFGQTLLVLLVVVGASTVSAVGTVAIGYSIQTATYDGTDKTCTTAIGYQFSPLGVCIPVTATSSVKLTSDSNGNIIRTDYATSASCGGTTGTDTTLVK